MKVSELGEFGLVDMLAKIVAASRNDSSVAWQRLILGIGDDCAAWQGDASVQIAHVDSVFENVHFTLDTTPWKDLGWKALAVTMSGVAAMGGVPTYALVSLTLTGDTQVEDVAAMYKGMTELSQRFGVAIIGGDTSDASVVSVTVTVLGNTGKRSRRYMMTRSAARTGDKIAVTGYPGAAASGFRMLTGRLKFSPEAASYLSNAFLRPTPRIAEGRILVENGVKCAIDISDGLVSDLGHVCRSSGVGAKIDVGLLPVHPLVRGNFGDRSAELALSGGEDYELLFTAGAELMSKIQDKVSVPVTVVGEIIADNTGKVVLVKNGSPFSLPKPGWEHFKQ
ncbi:MAG: thiamine-phosphate kinase [Dehalococcoidales bacterium]|nr:thiamine-phosphate kinase [Dehalococcoidales bacterium]